MERSQIPKYVMGTLCRICAEKSLKLTPIFECEELPLKISKCLPIQVNKMDHLPLKVCESCFFKISESYDLFIKADEADKRLKKLWKILLSETMTEYTENRNCAESMGGATAVQIHNFDKVQEETLEMSPSNLVINIPEEATYHNVEIFGDGHQMKPENNKMAVINKSVSFKIMNDNLVLKSSEKNGTQLQTYKILQKDPTELKTEIVNVEKTDEVNRMYQCQFCSYQSPSVDSVKTHEGTHSEERHYLCDTCGKFFKSTKYLKSHAKTHLAVRKKHICKICSKGFLTNFFLQEHMNSHTGETPYKCPVCEKEFRERVHLRQHKWTHANRKFVCPFCSSQFNRKGNMTEHIKQYHKNGSLGKSKKKTEENTKETNNLKCPVCNCNFQNQILLKSHLKIHPEQKRFCCAVCGKKFRHSGSLTYHRRTAHTGEKPFQCGYCDKKFSLRSVQIIHERKIHTFEHPYKCTFCSRPFTNSSSLRNHMYVHTKDKMFRCDECGKKFSRNSNLIVHKKLHTGDRKFTCEQCGKSYIQRHDLLKHQKIHDPKHKPFFCKYCGNSFSHKKDSVKHTMCQFDFLRKKNSDIFTAEKILDSVINSLEGNEKDFSAEEEQQLILESVKEFSEENIPKEGLIYPENRT